MKNSSFDLDTYTLYKNKLEKIRQENHLGIKQICEKIPLGYRTYKKLLSLDPENNLSYCTLRKIKKFIEKYF